MASFGDLTEMYSQRGKMLLVLNNFKYKEHYRKLASGESKWRCAKYKCKAFIHTLGESSNRVITSLNANHTHVPEERNVLERQILTYSAKRKAESDIAEKPAKVIRKELCEPRTNMVSVTSKDIHCVRKNIYYARRKLVPALPKSIGEVHEALNELNPKTSRNEQFLLINDNTENLVIFSCKSNLEFLCKSKIIYVDGTFSYCTKFFKQLFSIHGYFNGHYVPLVFCLLNDKSENTYKTCLLKIKNVCTEYNFQFLPQEVVVDFEIAIHKAVLQVWNNVKITGCRFHLTQSWYRQIQKLGLSQEYKNKNSDIGIWLRYCFGLLFLEPEEVDDFYFLELYELKPNNESLEKFSDYLLNTYLTNESKFPPHIWANASADLNKTTNACESFHSHFNNSLYQTHPHLFIFVNELLSVQSETYIKCNSINTPHRFNTVTKKKQNFIANKISEYKNNELTKLDYVKIVSHYYAYNNK